MKIGTVAYAALLCILSISQIAEGQRLPSRNNINKVLLDNIKKNTIHLTGHVSVKFAKGKDGKVAIPEDFENQLVLPTMHTMETPLDHTGKSNITFNQTYWVYDKYYKPGGPIFLYNSGEMDLTDYAGVWLNNSQILKYQREFEGLGIVLQHRYYGLSIPSWALVPGSKRIASEGFEYLTTDQALDDMKYFADRFNYTSPRAPANIDKTPKGAPWIVIGTSYGGNLASFLRRKYPDTFFAAYSSSAPVEARTDMPGYFEVIARAIERTEPACIRNAQSAINYIDRELGKGWREEILIKQLFLGPGGEANSNGWFADTLQWQFFDFQYSGIRASQLDDSEYTLKNFCDHMNRDGDLQSPIEGWEKANNLTLRRSGNWIAEQWAKWPGYFVGVRSGGYKCGGYGATDPQRCRLAEPMTDNESRAWIWQYCSEWGYFLVGNPGPNQIASNFSDTEHWRSKCRMQFPEGKAQQLLPMHKLPRTNETNKLFGGWSDPQSRTFYTAGERDPWSALGFLETRYLANGTDVPGYIASPNIPACDAKASRKHIFGFVIPDGLHTQDMSGGAWANEATTLFTNALKAWLPCWKPTMENQPKIHRNGTIPEVRPGIQTNRTISIGSPVARVNQTVLSWSLSRNMSLPEMSREIVRINGAEKKIRLERRARLWSE
ncbi:hypothetical protein TWF281_011083 [Arthrobotrys megalospora]